MREILQRYGERVRVETGDGPREVRAFMQPVVQQGKAAPFSMTALGSVDDRLWRYLGQAAVHPGETVEWNGESFTVCTSEPYYAGESLLHWWAILARTREAAK